MHGTDAPLLVADIDAPTTQFAQQTVIVTNLFTLARLCAASLPVHNTGVVPSVGARVVPAHHAVIEDVKHHTTNNMFVREFAALQPANSIGVELIVGVLAVNVPCALTSVSVNR